jgi:hypothetical protein
MNDEPYRWTPPDGITNHGEKSLSDHDDFFAQPPPEIGDVMTAFTTLRTDKQPWTLGMRLAVGFFVGCILAVIGFFVGYAMSSQDVREGLPLMIGLGVAGLGIGILIVMAATGFSHRCNYIAREGIAEFKCSGNRDNVSSSSIFPFSEAAELRTTQVRRYYNGIYQGTNYSFIWSDRKGRHRYTISGTHNSERGQPAAKDNYHFASGAELAWSNYLLQYVSEQLQRDGFLHFNLGGADYVRVGPDYLELRVGGETTECATKDIGALSLMQGMFTIKRRDAKEGWFSSKGVFKFNYNSLANAQLFLFLLEKLTGLRPY